MHRLEIMQAELEAHPLVTILVPSKRHDRREWDHIRCNVSVPPKWYRKLCGLHASKRGVRRQKFDTIIRRANVLRCLERMLAGNFRGRYAERIMSIL